MPKIPKDIDQAKNNPVWAYLTKEEKCRFEILAKRLNLSQSDLIRKRLFEDDQVTEQLILLQKKMDMMEHLLVELISITLSEITKTPEVVEKYVEKLKEETKELFSD